MKEEYKTLKFAPFAYLIPIGEIQKLPMNYTFTDTPFESRIYPETVRLSTIDKSSIVLTFMHNSL